MMSKDSVSKQNDLCSLQVENETAKGDTSAMSCSICHGLIPDGEKYYRIYELILCRKCYAE